jgi:hypothetical protein
MSIAFDQIIRNGLVVLPEHVHDVLEGELVHVVIETQSDRTGQTSRCRMIKLIRNPVRASRYEPPAMGVASGLDVN